MNFNYLQRLADEVKRLEGQLEKEELEKKTVSLELENLLKQLETPNSSFTAGAVEAGSVREIIALRRKVCNFNIIICAAWPVT